ncbi:hypothetical protein VNO78_06830 [Psophocarpus tetragonolobus]|uniref:Neprosin PEP catalytic domain-containing protein n=1 Tax=Psophocarpus tetragonolobus TaxID=3891 RepID=A0AAN9XRD5_PSOTE
MMNLLLFVLCLVTINPSHSVDGVQDTLKEDLEFDRQLKLINKPPIKSIQTKFGYIVDCIDIKKQPAFDHPLLKNHKLQRKPSFQKSNEKASLKNSPDGILLGLEKDECPEGTVPIRRTTKDDLIRTKSLNHSMLVESLMQSVPGLHIDNFKKTGCINMLCPGFVQVSKGTYLGLRINQTSIYGGPSYEYPISITQDESSKNWWLVMGNVPFGYYPKELFSNLTSAERVGFGGRTRTAPNTPSPQMGSGYFPDSHHTSHACYFREIRYHNASRIDLGPKDYGIDTFTDNSNCFGVEYRGDLYGGIEYISQFGGPGGNCGI